MNLGEIFIVLFKEYLKIEAYSSFEAIFLAHTKKEIGKSKYVLRYFDFSIEDFENEKVKIVKIKPKTTNDIRKEHEIF